jgi:hypothetical protein
MGTAPASHSAEPGTVYEGTALPLDNPWVGNRYVGKEKTSAGEPEAPTKQTIFDENTFVAGGTDGATVAATTPHCARWASLRFFIITVLALIETLIWIAAGSTWLAVASAMVTGTFAILGIMAARMNKTAFLIGASVYVAESLCLIGRWSPLMFLPVIVHAILVWRLYCMYGVLQDME